MLGDFGQNDWQLSSLVCKTLWNFSDRVTSSAVCFGSEEADLLTEQLEVYLGMSVAVTVQCVQELCILHLHSVLCTYVRTYNETCHKDHLYRRTTCL